MSKYDPPPGNLPRISSAALIIRCLAAVPSEEQERLLRGLVPDATGELPKKRRDKLVKVALDLGVMPRPALAVRKMSDVSPSLLDDSGKHEAEAVLGTKIVGGRVVRFAPMPVPVNRRVAQ